MKPGKLLVLIGDPTTNDQPALRRACSFARDFGAEICLHTVAHNSQLASRAVKDERDRERLATILVEKRLDDLHALAEVVAERGIDCNYSVVWDYPTHESLARTVVNGGYDFVLFDSFGRTEDSTDRVMLSQTDWQTLANCPVPCLLVRTSGLNPYSSVLAAVDPTHAEESTASLDDQIVETGQLMSRTFGAGLRILHAYQPIVSAQSFPTEGKKLPVELADKALEESLKREVNELAAKHQLDEQTVLLRRGRAAATILGVVKETFADLVVMGAISRGRLHDWVIGSTAERVIGDLDCDLLALKPAGFKARLGKPAKHHVLRDGYRAAQPSKNSA